MSATVNLPLLEIVEVHILPFFCDGGDHKYRTYMVPIPIHKNIDKKKVDLYLRLQNGEPNY